MKKKKKILIACIIAVLVIAPIYAIFASFNGSIIYKVIATKKARTYVSEKYPNQEFEVSFAIYDFKMNAYFCKVQSPTSEDTAFDVYVNRKTIDDDYDISVIQKENTLSRLCQELDDYVDEKLAAVYPHRTRLFMCTFYEGEPLNHSKLELDMKFDINNLPYPLELVVWSETEEKEPTNEELTERLKELADITDQLGMNISYFSYNLEYPYDESGEKPVNYDSEIYVEKLAKEKIFKE